MVSCVFSCQPKGCFSHTAWTQDFISWLRILCSCRGNTCRMTPRALSSGTAHVGPRRGSGEFRLYSTDKKRTTSVALTDWLAFQEVDVMKHLPVFGSQIVHPVFDDALPLLWQTREGRSRGGETGLYIRLRVCLSERAREKTTDLRGEKAQFALNVLVDVVLLAGEAPRSSAKLRLHRFPQSHLLGAAQ